MGEKTRAKIGTAEGVKTVRVYSANPKTVDGYNTFIFRRDIARSLSKLAWAPVIDGSRNPVLEGVELGDRSVRYSADDKRRLIEFVERIADAQKGSIENDDFGHFEITKIFATEVQCHAISTRREIESVSSAAEIARSLIHFVGSPNEEQKRKKPNKYFEYGLAKIRLSDGVYLVMGEVGIRVNKRPYYDQRVVAKFKADSEVSSLHGQTQIGESAFEQVYDNRFRLILQGVELYYKQSPKFSIIIPVYNVAPYLRECLDSVLAQTFTNWEAICVDDGSTDGSGSILDEYAEKDCRFRVIHTKNGGVSRARNIGIATATGDYVTFLDGDDLYERGWLAEARRILNESSVDLLRMKPVLFADGKMPSFRCRFEYRTFSDNEVRRWGWKTYAKYGWACVSFIRRSHLTMIDEPFPVGMTFMEDNIFSLGLIERCCSAAQGEYAGYGYRQHETSVCAGHRPVANVERLFDEVMVLISKCQDSDRVAIQGMLCAAVLDWRRSNLFSCASLGGMVTRLKAARANGAFLWKRIPLRWCLGFIFLEKCHWCGIVDALLLLQHYWGICLKGIR